MVCRRTLRKVWCLGMRVALIGVREQRIDRCTASIPQVIQDQGFVCLTA